MRRWWPELAWGAFAAVNVAAMFAVPEWETVPFHLVWISLTLLYGVRVWPWRPTVAVLVAVMAATTVGELHPGVDHHAEVQELVEVPLMAAVFLAMVWHARRRQSALHALERATERERDFLRDASHRLRTPITVARGHAELIRREARDDQTAADAGVVLDELATLAVVSERLLTMGAADHPDFLVRNEVRIDGLLHQVVERWSPCADRAWRVEAGAVVACCDPERIVAALDALVENAVAHTEPGDRIVLSAQRGEGAVRLLVTDSGSGVPAEAVERVFERFSRATDRRPGTGLGLPMARAIARAHGGDASLRSVHGAGTTVELRLPAPA